jgi:hypothetical protein
MRIDCKTEREGLLVMIVCKLDFSQTLAYVSWHRVKQSLRPVKRVQAESILVFDRLYCEPLSTKC